MRFDPSLYLIAGTAFCRGQDLLAAVSRSVAGGVTLVQLREKEATLLQRIELAKALVNIVKPFGVPLVVNDCVETALAAGAQGVHLGQSDGSPRDARRRLGPQAILGISIETSTPLASLEWDGIDYAAASPVFATPTKSDTDEPFGLEGLRRLREQVNVPLVAIGGIHEGNLSEVLAAGADGVAVVSCVLSAANETEAARNLCRLIQVHRGVENAAR